MTVGSLFSGIGGLDLGLEWAGMETEWFCEIEPFAQEVLKRHWPDKTIISDIRDINEEAIAEGSIRPVDIIAGGFPCQDISYAGKRRGLDYDLDTGEGTRSGLWWEMWRVVRLLRPRYVIAENVPGLFTGGIDIVLGSLAQIGYDAEWEVLSAGIVDSRGNALTGVGAPHQRDRVFIVGCRQDAVGDSVSVGLQGNARGRTGAQSANGHAQEQLAEDAADTGHQFREVSDQRRQSAEQEPRSNGEAGRSGSLDSLPQPSWFGGLWPQPWPVSFKRGKDVGNAALPRELERVAPVGCFCRMAARLPDGLVKNEVDNGTEGEKRDPEAVCELRGHDDEEAFQRATGGSGRIQAPEVLQPVMYVEGDGQRQSEEAYLPEQGEGSPGHELRELRNKDVLASPPQGRGHNEQPPVQSPDALRQLPHEAPLAGVEEDGGARQADQPWSPPLFEIDGHICTDVPDRTGRLKALGNAVVPQVGYLVGRAVMAHAKETGRL